MFSKILQNSQESSFDGETPTQLFSCEIYETFKNTNFEEHLWWMTASTSSAFAVRKMQKRSFLLLQFINFLDLILE